MSADPGPRTMRRNTGAHGIVMVGRVIANRYRIESLVGAGAIGAVYKASHVDLPRTFAIKVLHPHFRADADLLASFRTEARAASLLDHPNVTVVHDFGEEPDGLVYIVMEYLAGVNLQAVLDEERRLEPRRAIAIMVQICSALSAAHERGIVHRDVKPDNVMLVPSRDDEGRPFEMVKVCDFGIAALETSGSQGAASGQWTAGTPEYMAPEQAQGHADARTDIYACGIVLYEMVTGRPPFVGDSPAATLAKHVTDRARRPAEIVPGIPSQLEAVILCAMEKSPALRFGSMRDFRAELKRLL
jgi:serine/threonine-protein kinase